MKVINEAKTKVYKNRYIRFFSTSGFIGDGFIKGSLRIFQGKIPCERSNSNLSFVLFRLFRLFSRLLSSCWIVENSVILDGIGINFFFN